VELTGRFRDQDQVATWRSDDGGAMANEEPNRSLLWPAVLVGIGAAGSLDEIVLHQLTLLAGLLVLRVASSPRAAPSRNGSYQGSG